jgi:hypothetical protein
VKSLELWVYDCLYYTRFFLPFPHLMVRTDKHLTQRNSIWRVQVTETMALTILAPLRAKNVLLP